jgi:thiol-disulfide isomerase/thioredoxin
MRSVLIVLFSLCALHGFSQQYNPGIANYFGKLSAKTFPAIELLNENDSIINTAMFAGKTIYVDMWFTTCPPCLKEIPFAKELKSHFAKDTNIIFLNICIDYEERRNKWKQLVKDKEIGGINLFYARNKPQKINLIRELIVYNYPTFYIVNAKGNITCFDAPAPSEKGTVHWMLHRVNQGYSASASYREMMERSKDYRQFVNNSRELFR